jgi:acetyl esterase/lipase
MPSSYAARVADGEFQNPFVLPLEVRVPERHDRVDLYLPDKATAPSPLLADWLRRPPGWLRCVAASYPLLAPLPGWEVDPRFRPVEAVASAGDLPIVLTRVGRERPPLAATVEAFTEAADRCGARLEIIDVPGGQHAFDMLDHTDESRQAVRRALSAVLAVLAE